MISIIKKLWSKKRIVLFWAIITLGGYGMLSITRGEESLPDFKTANSEQILEWMKSRAKPEEYMFQNINFIDENLMKKLRSYLGIEIPESAEDIYIFYQYYTGGEKIVFCSLTLSAEEVSVFATKFIGVPLSEFKKGTTSEDRIINNGPAGVSKRFNNSYWALKDIKNAKYYEVRPTEKSKKEFKKKLEKELKKRGIKEKDLDEYLEGYYHTYSSRFIAVDMDINRVYIYVE